MKAIERDDLIRQVHQSIYGVEGTEDKGMAGDVKDIKDCLTNVKKDVSKNTAFRKTGIAIFTAAIGILISKIQGLW